MDLSLSERVAELEREVRWLRLEHRQLDSLMRIEESLNRVAYTVTQQGETMGQNLEQLRAEVAETKTVVGSAIALIDGFRVRIQEILDGGAKAEDLIKLRTELDATNADLAAAVEANTPAAPEAPAEPAPTETPVEEPPAEPAAPEEPPA
ncbi:MAG TPA: hypothetical protein VJY35_06680 [Candidatus Eisenbacteria bacterium]|nr:hypothetical protein [Candidatus Eisenbacteria bacterium]